MTTPNPITVNPPGLQQAGQTIVSPEPPPIAPIPADINTIAEALTQLINRVNSIENWMSNGQAQRPLPFSVAMQEVRTRVGQIETDANRIVGDLAAKIDIITKVGQLNGKVNEAVETNKAAQSLKSAIESNYPDETDSLQKAIDAATDS